MLKHDVTNEELVLNFRPVAGGLKQDIDNHFLQAFFWAPQEWENTWGANKFKSWLFLNRFTPPRHPQWRRPCFKAYAAELDIDQFC